MGARLVLVSGVWPSGATSPRPEPLPSLAPTLAQPLPPDGRCPWPPEKKVG